MKKLLILNTTLATLTLLPIFFASTPVKAAGPEGTCQAPLDPTCLPGSATECCQPVTNNCSAGYIPVLSIVDPGMGAPRCECKCKRPTSGSATCDVAIGPDNVVITINDPANETREVKYMLGIWPADCKTFNGGRTKFFCWPQISPNPKPPGSSTTTATIPINTFHRGKYFALIYEHYWSAGITGSCKQTSASISLGNCYFDLTNNDDAAECGTTGDCKIKVDTTDPTCDDTKIECCQIDEDRNECFDGYFPTIFMSPTGMAISRCYCECTTTGGATYDPCKNLPNHEIDSEQRRCYNCYAEDKTWTALGCIPSRPADFIRVLIRIGFGIGGGLAFLFMIMGAFKILTSEGNPETINAGRQMITNAIAGLVLIIFSVIVLKIIGVDVLQLPGF